DEDGEALDLIERPRRQRSVVEAAGDVGVAILVEVDGAARGAGVDLDVDTRRRTPALAGADPQLAVGVSHAHREPVSVVDPGLAIAGGLELDDQVLAAERRRDVE